ncbi:MAG: diguanylate cyclase, partial [Pirellulales bacterium]
LIEVACLLHDVGKIGVPDPILLKPERLTADEFAVMEQYRLHGIEILRCGCAAPPVLEMIHYSAAWFDGTRHGYDRWGTELPLGARMLAVADAFDSMTWDSPYRRAVPQERAIAELYRVSGTQFDPDLVKIFAALHECDQTSLHEQVAQRWFEELDHDRVNSLWQLTPHTGTKFEHGPSQLFQQTLLDNMRDAVAFLDANRCVTFWSAGAERMTGLSASSMQGNQFTPCLLDMRDDGGVTVPNEKCPVADSISTGEQRYRRLVIRGRGRKDVSVEAQIVPAIADDGVTHGTTLVLHDVSPEISLEARCHSLHELATRDPLTQVANRAEFNRVHGMIVHAHLERELPCSLIITDIDHFKKVNDTFGHPAGDEVLKTFAKVMKSGCRPGDLVARYGGEEFVIVCADCDSVSASRRAEEIRKRISMVQHACLDGKRVTASFGVTEVQHGDSPELMLARADRALYEAKDRGRNNVVQLGTGMGITKEALPDMPAPDPSREHLLAEQDLIMAVPLSVAIEKLRGFVSDHSAEVINVGENTMRIRIGPGGIAWLRRLSDQTVPFLLDISFQELPQKTNKAGRFLPIRTRVHVEILPVRRRDRRKAEVAERAKQLLTSFRSYLMAAEYLGDDELPAVQG